MTGRKKQAKSPHEKADEEAAAAGKLELAIRQAAQVIVSGRYTREQCIGWIGDYFAKSDRERVTARITAAVQNLKDEAQSTLNLMKAAETADAKPTHAGEFLARFIDLGWPVRAGHPGRGPKPKGTQYDAARKRRKDLYRKLIKLPKARVLAAAKRRQTANPTREEIQSAAEAVATAYKGSLTNAVFDELLTRNKPRDESTVRRHLKALGHQLKKSPPRN